jgi:hypothetical protein|nr:MAG TPA: hypothetical protein [Bacteriophage sp.]
MATFTFRKIESNDEKFNKASEQIVGGGGGQTPFRTGSVFVPSGSYGYLVTNEGTDKERYNLVLEGKIAGVDTYLWVSMLLKTGTDKDGKEVFVDGFNKVCADANLVGMTNKAAGEFIINKLKKPDGTFYNLKAKRIPFVTLYSGNQSLRTLVQFDLI